jgi:hypothetical protein
VSWAVCAVQLPDGDQPVDLWMDDAGCLVTDPIPMRNGYRAGMWSPVWSMPTPIPPSAGKLECRLR